MNGSDDRIEKGDVYWCSIELADGAQPLPHPYVVIQDTVINQSRIDTVVVCGITSNMKKADWPGYVILNPGEADLPRKSVVDVSQVSTVKKEQIGTFIGRLSPDRLAQIFAGMNMIQKKRKRA